MKTETFPVTARGVGRRDYSDAIEFASAATAKGLQARAANTARYFGVPVVAWPDFWVMLFLFADEYRVVSEVAPRIAYHIFNIEVAGEGAALTLAGLYRFATYDDIWMWNVDKWYGDMFGYGKAALDYTKGIKTAEGKYYLIAFSQYTEKPSFNVHIKVNMLNEEVFYG